MGNKTNERIVVIEDDDQVRDNLIKIFSSQGYVAFGAKLGKDGLELILAESPDLIICDITLPDTNGYKILNEVSANKSTKKIPFIFLTAKVEMSDLRKGMNLGADDYITKPFHIKDLLDSVKMRLLKNSVRQEEAEETNKSKVLGIDQKIFLPFGNELEFIMVSDIVFISADGMESMVSTRNGEKSILRKNLKEWQKILPKEVFVRINRSNIVNINYIQKIEKWFGNTYRIKLQGVEENLIISKNFLTTFKDTFQS